MQYFLTLLSVEAHVLSLYPPAMFPKTSGAKTAVNTTLGSCNGSQPSPFLGARQRCVEQDKCTSISDRMKDLNDHYPMRNMDVCTNPDLPEDQIDILGSDFAMFQSTAGQFEGKPAHLQNKKAPSGAAWVESNPSVPSVCPGETIKARTYLAIDHAGVFAWSRKNSVGKWEAFTQWRSINNDPEITIFNINNQPWEANQCGTNGKRSEWETSPQKWSPSVEHCRSLSTFEYDLQIPADAPEGRFQMMFTYMGGMDKDTLQNIGAPMSNPEKAMFISCTYVNIKSGCNHKPDEPTLTSTVEPTAGPSGPGHHEGIPDITVNVNVAVHL